MSPRFKDGLLDFIAYTLKGSWTVSQREVNICHSEFTLR